MIIKKLLVLFISLLIIGIIYFSYFYEIKTFNTFFLYTSASVISLNIYYLFSNISTKKYIYNLLIILLSISYLNFLTFPLGVFNTNNFELVISFNGLFIIFVNRFFDIKIDIKNKYVRLVSKTILIYIVSIVIKIIILQLMFNSNVYILLNEILSFFLLFMFVYIKERVSHKYRLIKNKKPFLNNNVFLWVIYIFLSFLLISAYVPVTAIAFSYLYYFDVVIMVND